MQNKVVVPGKVEKDKNNNKKYKIKAHKSDESDLDYRTHWATVITRWKN